MEITILHHGTRVPDNEYYGYSYGSASVKNGSFTSCLHMCYEVIRVISGGFVFTAEGSEYRASDGDIIVTSPDELHSFSFPKNNGCQYEFLQIYPGFIEIAPDELSAMIKSRTMGSNNLINTQKAAKYNLDAIFDDIRNACENSDDETDMIVYANTLLLAAKIHYILRADVPQYNRNSSKSEVIYKYIENNFREDITIESTSKLTGMSNNAVRYFFKSETGMTIKAYLNMRRATAAKNLMLGGQNAMAVFKQCGFNDYSTFFRAFSKYVGMTPDEFKRKHEN